MRSPSLIRDSRILSAGGGGGGSAGFSPVPIELRISLLSPEPVLLGTYKPLAPSCGGAGSATPFWTPIGIRRGASSRFPDILLGETAVDCGCEGVGRGPGGGAKDTGGESGRIWGSAVIPISGSSNRN